MKLFYTSATFSDIVLIENELKVKYNSKFMSISDIYSHRPICPYAHIWPYGHIGKWACAKKVAKWGIP